LKTPDLVKEVKVVKIVKGVWHDAFNRKPNRLKTLDLVKEVKVVKIVKGVWHDAFNLFNYFNLFNHSYQ
jgi:hypothetical protein